MDDTNPQPTVPPMEAPTPGGDVDVPAPQQDQPATPGQPNG